MDARIDLGPCCGCQRTGEAVRNVITLPFRVGAAGGWGCLVCDLPLEGALAVLCDACVDTLEGEPPTYCVGYPRLGVRLPLPPPAERERFEHGPHAIAQ